MIEQQWALYLAAAALLVLGASAALMIYYARRIRRMERILQSLQEQGSAPLDTMRESRESKLENRLQRILSQTAREQEQAAQERDEVTMLLSDLSHQLKTPLANVLMYAELLQDDSLDEAQRTSFAAETHRQAEKMQWLMKDMLKASRLEQGSVAFPADFCSIKKTVEQAVCGVRAQAERKKIRVVTEPFEDRALYHNPRWTAEALENILDNAVKYAPEGSQIAVRLRPLEIYTGIEIADEGIGVAPAEYNDIFKRFYRGKQVEQQEGNGLGLYLAQLILNREKGYITVSSQRGKGSCFCVYLLNRAEK